MSDHRAVIDDVKAHQQNLTPQTTFHSDRMIFALLKCIEEDQAALKKLQAENDAYRRNQESFGDVQLENPQPAFMWALVFRETGKRRVAFSFDGPPSPSYVKLVNASAFTKVEPK